MATNTAEAGSKIFENTFSAFEYYWKANTNSGVIRPEHIDALTEDAEDRIAHMVKEGYERGELHTYVKIDDADGEDGVSYSGFWKPKSN